MMPALRAAIVRVVDEAQPGWVECRFTDSAGREHVIVEKVPVVTNGHVSPSDVFPIPIAIACVVRMSPGGYGVTVDLGSPWSVESDSGLRQFTVRADQVVPCVFVSCANIDAADARCLLYALRAVGCVVDHSPREPSAGPDPRWSTWYQQGLNHAVAQADAFVAVIDRAWDCSSWMAEEAHHALESAGVPHAFFWNPRAVPVRAMHQYLRTRLPDEAESAARAVRRVDLKPAA